MKPYRKKIEQYEGIKIPIRVCLEQERTERTAGTRVKKIKISSLVKNSLLRFAVLLLIINFNCFGVLSIGQTAAFLNDTETASGSFTAGSLDFYLTSASSFSPSPLEPGESAIRTIDFLNTSNIPKYMIEAVNFNGQICDYLQLEAGLDGGDVLYSGNLTDFIYGPLVFEDPEIWSFKLTLLFDAPETVHGQTCGFDFVFYGSQTKNDLPLGQGFNDTEEIDNNISAKVCYYSEARSMGYWKNHPEVYAQYLPQYLGDYPLDDWIETEEEVNGIFNDYNLSMRNKLRGQLLVMKFNIAHFDIGEYFIDSEGRTIDQIVSEADGLLRNLSTPDSVLEGMKNLLDYLNNLHQIKYCFDKPIVINEFLPNPDGNECSLNGLEGEWVEIYNTSSSEIDLLNWHLEDENAEHTVVITPENTLSGSTVIGAQGSGNEWLVVFLNGCILNNDGDSVNLFNSDSQLLDFYTYTGPVPSNKSYARIPDGTNHWYDPVPTPGGPNILEMQIEMPIEAINVSEEVIEEVVVEEVAEETSIEAGTVPEINEEVIEEEIISEEEEVIILSEEEIYLASEATTTEETATTTEEVATTEEIPAVEESAAEEPPIQEEPVTENEEPAVVEEESPAVEEQPAVEPADENNEPDI